MIYRKETKKEPKRVNPEEAEKIFLAWKREKDRQLKEKKVPKVNDTSKVDIGSCPNSHLLLQVTEAKKKASDEEKARKKEEAEKVS